MRSFAFERARSLPDALKALESPGTMVISGGTEILNWMKEGIVAPDRLLDINGLTGLNEIRAGQDGLSIGALARMSDVAEHEAVRRDYPAMSQALLKSASPQIRNMASMGGNLLQRTRCPYFRAEVDLPCNKRRPGSGCAALEGEDRSMAVFGWSEKCLATNPSDLAVALAALEAVVRVRGRNGERSIPLGDFHRLPGDTPEREANLDADELIVAIEVPASPLAKRSHYLKLRERASYEFALISVAVGLDLDGSTIRRARVALGGVAHKPWRLVEAEAAFEGKSVDDETALRSALDATFGEAQPRRNNGIKVELAKRAVIRALKNAAGVS
jgi:xanthine dehydrogenase YagS FAD-binding subunit